MCPNIINPFKLTPLTLRHSHLFLKQQIKDTWVWNLRNLMVIIGQKANEFLAWHGESPCSFQTDCPTQSVNLICFHGLLHLSIDVYNIFNFWKDQACVERLVTHWFTSKEGGSRFPGQAWYGHRGDNPADTDIVGDNPLWWDLNCRWGRWS